MRELLHYCGLQDQYDTVRDWYDGYNFAGQNIYSPWDVLLYCQSLLTGGLPQPQNYWANTSGNDIVRELINLSTRQIRGQIEQLLAGESVEKVLNSNLTYRDLTLNPDNLFTVLFHTGYLTLKDGQQGSEEGRAAALVIPNKEIRILFRTQILSWFQQKVLTNHQQHSAFAQALFDGQPEQVRQVLNQVMRDAISVRDYGARDELRENFYHGMLIGLLSDTDYVQSNRESGDGYPDLTIQNDESGTGIILELKYSKTLSGMEDACDRALAQIREKEYETALLREGMTTIYSYGIAFCRKVCQVKMEKTARSE